MSLISKLAFFRKKSNMDKGSVLILVTFSLSTLLGFGAIVTDLGMIYIEKARLQNSLDAAILAGAQELPARPQAAIQVTYSYAQKNGITLDSVTVTGNNKKITAKSYKEVPAYFAKIWGVERNTIYAKSRAAVVPLTSFTGAVPLSVQKQNFVFGAQYVLKSGSWNANLVNYYPGWFGAVQVDGSGAASFRDDLINGASSTIRIGQILNIETGNMSGPTLYGISARFAMDTREPPNTFGDHDRDAPQIVYLPIIEPVSQLGEAITKVKVVGFAAFFIEGALGNGTDSVITGRFLRTIVPNAEVGQSLDSLLRMEEELDVTHLSNDFGVYAPKLIQ